jgi:hypothetical protein
MRSLHYKEYGRVGHTTYHEMGKDPLDIGPSPGDGQKRAEKPRDTHVRLTKRKKECDCRERGYLGGRPATVFVCRLLVRDTL